MGPKRAAEQFAERFEVESDYKLLLDTRAYLMERIGKMEFPEALLRRIMEAGRAEKDAPVSEEDF